MVLISINVLFTLIIGSAINPIWVLQTMHTEDVNINQHQLVDELAYMPYVTKRLAPYRAILM